jgi:hypothetical protein
MALPSGSTIRIKLAQLELDPENPRLPMAIRGGTEKVILEYIARTSSIEELMEAIGENDYFEAEPLLVYKVSGSAPKYRVIEGNRRLTALKLLSDPELLPKRVKLAEIASAAKFRPVSIPVAEFSRRDDVFVYLGYRHITGVKAWEPLAKARYLHGLFEYFRRQTPRQDTEQVYREVAKAIGSTIGFVRKTLNAHTLFRYIEDENFFEIDGLSELTIDFSILSTAIGYQNFKDYLSISGDLTLQGKKLGFDPKRLEVLTKWLFEKDDNQATRIGESRNLKRLNVVLANPEALRNFSRGASIETAYRQTVGVIEDFVRHLHNAHDSLITANGLRADVDADEEISDLVKKLGRQIDVLKKSLND